MCLSNSVVIMLLLSIGAILLLIELVTPGFGLAGISGIILLIIGCYRAFTTLNVMWGISTTAGSILLLIFFYKIFTSSFIWKKIKLGTQEDKTKGFSSSEDFSRLVDKQGSTITPLRPSGIVVIDGIRWDVVTDGLFIEKDTIIKVIRVEGNKIIVRGV